MATDGTKDYSGLIVNAFNGQCITAESDGAGMVTKPCDPNSSHQIITITDANKTSAADYEIKHTLNTSATVSGNDRGVIDTWRGVLYWSDECGTGNDCHFHVQSMGNTAGLTAGPFKFWGWGRQGGNDAALHTDGILRQDQAYDNQPRATWLTYREAEKCKSYGVPLDKCTSNQINIVPANAPECFQYEQYKRGDTGGCPLAASCKEVGLALRTDTCTAAKVTQTKQCQAVDLTSCTTESLAARRLRCYNMGLCVDAQCNVASPGTGGCTTKNITTWEDSCTKAKIALDKCNVKAASDALLTSSASDALKEQTQSSKDALAAVQKALEESLRNEEPIVVKDSNTGTYVILALVVLVILCVGGYLLSE